MFLASALSVLNQACWIFSTVDPRSLFLIYRMAISLCFDGHVRNVGALGLDVFLTFTVASATELPADTMLTVVLDRWGRRWLACGSMVLSGIFSLLASVVPTGTITLRV